MASLGKLPPLFPHPSGGQDGDTSQGGSSTEIESSSDNLDEFGRPLVTACSVVEKLPKLRDIIKSPHYLGTHSISPGDTLEVDNDPSTGASLKLELTGEVLRDGGNTLCLHCSASLPGTPASPKKQRAPLSMADLLAGMPSATVMPTAIETATLSSGSASGEKSGGSGGRCAESSGPAAPQQASEAVMITGQVPRLARGASAPAPKQPVPNCFRTKYIGPYRLRILKVEVLAPPNTSPSPEISPDSTLRDTTWYPGRGADQLASGMGTLAQPSVAAHVAVDRVDSRRIWQPTLPDQGAARGSASVHCQHLPEGEECTLWLTTQSWALQQVSFGSPEDSFTICLHVRLAPPQHPELRPLVEADGEEVEEDEVFDLWDVELDLMRCGPVEAASVIKLDVSDETQPVSRIVGDYRVTLERQVAPACGPHRSGAVLCRYPIILAHTELRVERLTEGSGEPGGDLAGGDGLSFLDEL